MHAAEQALAEARGFMKSRVILTAAALDLFTLLDEEPRSAGALAQALGLDARAAARLLDCLAALGVLAKHDGVLRLTEAGAPYSGRHPQSVLPMLRHLNRLWDTWSGLTQVVRTGDNPAHTGDHIGGRTGGRTGCAAPDEASRKAFIQAMHVVGRDLSEAIARDFDLSPYRRLLDIGGASGTYTIAFLRHNPAMTACLFDLPAVLPLARERLDREGLTARVQLAPGDFTTDALPAGCDLALLSAIIHQNSPQQNLELFAKVHTALTPGGVLLIRDHIMDESRTRPPAGALFAINMLVNTPGGDCYTLREVREGLEQAGFTNVRQLRQGEAMDCLVQARKPG